MIMGGCVRRVIGAVVLVAALAAAWLFRDQLRSAWREARGVRDVVLEPSPELAAVAERKIESLLDGSSSTIALSAIELQSLLQYRHQGALPAFLVATRVELDGDLLRLRSRVPIDNLPHVDGLAEIIAFLPDTTDMAIAARLLPLDSGRIALGIEEVSAARIPLPRRIVPPILERIGRRDEPGLPGDAIAVRLPAGVVAAYVRRDSLYLLARTRTVN